MKPLNREKELEVMLTLCVAFIVLWWTTGQQHRWLLSAALTTGLAGLFLKRLTALLAKGWMKLAEAMGSVMNKVLLSLIFFLLLVPVALLSRWLSRQKNNLQLQKPEGNTYYFDRNQRYTPKDLENTW